MKPLTPIDIARVAHEVNRVYCLAIGDASQPVWDEAPQWQQVSAINGVEYHLRNPGANPRESHENWYAEKYADGWVYAEEKNSDLKQHPCMLPYDELPKEQQVKDYLFKKIVDELRTYL